MERTSKEEVNIPSIKEIRLERRRLARQNRKRRIFLNTIYTLIIVAAVAVLLATLFFWYYKYLVQAWSQHWRTGRLFYL